MANGTPRELRVADIAANAVAVLVTLDVPSRGTIHKLVIEQTSGTPGAFDVDLYNEATPSEAARVLPSQDGASGLMSYFNDSGMPYTNQEHTNSSDRQRKLYLRITPGASGVKTYRATILTVGQGW